MTCSGPDASRCGCGDSDTGIGCGCAGAGGCGCSESNQGLSLSADAVGTGSEGWGGSVTVAPCAIGEGPACRPECGYWLDAYDRLVEERENLADSAPWEAWALIDAWIEFTCEQYEKCCMGERTRRHPPWTFEGQQEDEERREEEEEEAAEAAAAAAAAAEKEKARNTLDCGGPGVQPGAGLFGCDVVWPNVFSVDGVDFSSFLINTCMERLKSFLRLHTYSCKKPCPPQKGMGKPKSCSLKLQIPPDAVSCRVGTLSQWLGDQLFGDDIDNGDDGFTPSPEDPSSDYDFEGHDNPPAWPDPNRPSLDDDGRTGDSEGDRASKPSDFGRKSKSGDRQRIAAESARVQSGARGMKGARAWGDFMDVAGAMIGHCEYNLDKIKVECVCDYELKARPPETHTKDRMRFGDSRANPITPGPGGPAGPTPGNPAPVTPSPPAPGGAPPPPKGPVTPGGGWA